MRVLGDSAMVRENRNLVLEAYRHSHAIQPFCINGFASMPTGVWSKRACRFRIGWHGRAMRTVWGPSVQVFEAVRAAGERMSHITIQVLIVLSPIGFI